MAAEATTESLTKTWPPIAEGFPGYPASVAEAQPSRRARALTGAE
jgi:hypothetical protein